MVRKISFYNFDFCTSCQLSTYILNMGFPVEMQHSIVFYQCFDKMFFFFLIGQLFKCNSIFIYIIDYGSQY